MPVVEVVAGSLEAEQVLIEELEQSRRDFLRDPTALAPFQLIVPDEALRTWWISRLTHRLGSLAGVEIVSLGALIARLEGRRSRSPLVSDLQLGLLASRFATSLAPLRSLAMTSTGRALITRSLRDLLSAGWEPAHSEALREMLGSSPSDRRAAALLTVAERARQALDELGLRDRSGQLRELVEHTASSTLPRARPRWFLGFDDSTGLELDLLQSLAASNPLDRHIVSSGSDPTSLGDAARSRLAGSAGEILFREPSSPSGVEPTLWEADDAGTEARAVASHTSLLIREGVPLHRIGWASPRPRAQTADLRNALERTGYDDLLAKSSETRAGLGFLRALRASEPWSDTLLSMEEHRQLLQKEGGLDVPPMVREALDSLGRRPWPSLSADEFLEVLEGSIAASAPRLLTLEEAAGRTWDHLFVLGIDRRSFPRATGPDPLLTEGLRARWAEIFPDLDRGALESRSRDRAVVARLQHAARHVTLSWVRGDARGNGGPSSLLLPLLDSDAIHRIESWIAAETPLPPSSSERIVRAGLWAGPAAWRREMARHLQTLGVDERDAHRLVRYRESWLGIVDPAPGSRFWNRPGPDTGSVGRAIDPRDPRRGDLWITHLESLAVCPWKTLLARVMRLEEEPEPSKGSDVDGILREDVVFPSIDRRRLGALVHKALEAIGRSPERPHPEDLDSLLRREAREIFPLPLAGAASIRARSLVEVALERDWSPAPPQDAVVEVVDEVRGDLPLGGRRLRWVADRIDGGGALRTDYKLGQPTDLERGLVSGRKLQAAAYVYGRPPGLRARYLHLDPTTPDDEREVTVASEDTRSMVSFASSLQRALAIWDGGLFLPRLVELGPDVEPRACRTCSVAAACRRPESGTRRRIREWALSAPSENDSPAASALRDLWRSLES